MPTKIASGLGRGAVLTVAAVALATAVTGCKGAVVVAAPDAATASGAAAATPAVSQSSGSGALSVAITSPITLSGSSAVDVSCAAGVGYHAEATSAVIHGDQVSYTVAIARYHGPGSYPAVVAVTLHQASGVVTAVAGVSKVPAVITSGGGSFSVSATGTDGRTFTGSLDWTCGS